MSANTTVGLESECLTLRERVKQLEAEIERQKETISELENKRDTLRYMLDHPLTPEEIAELERWGKEVVEQWERGELVPTSPEDLMAELDEIVKKESCSRKADTVSSTPTS